MTPANGQRPSTGDAKLRVRWANGDLSRYTYSAAQLRWTKTKSPFDVDAWELVA